MGRWTDYANRYGYQLGALFNDDMRQVIKIGIHTLVANTYMDSGRAAAHWMVVPNTSKVGSGNRSQSRFPNPDFGEGLVGDPGDKKSASGESKAMAEAVTQREMEKAISKAVSGRKPATRFAFHSSVPEFWDDSEKDAVGGGWNYHKTAGLEEARRDAQTKMNIKFNQLMAAGTRRKNPLR